MKARPTQSRKGVKGQLPLAGSRDSVPCGVWGNAPTVPRATISPNALNKGAGSEASLPVTLRSRRSAPKLLFPSTQHCRARWARPTNMGEGFLSVLVFFIAEGFVSIHPSFSGKKFPKCAFSPCAKRKSMLQYARIEAFERAEAFAPVRENVFGDNPDDELRKEDFSYAVRLL